MKTHVLNILFPIGAMLTLSSCANDRIQSNEIIESQLNSHVRAKVSEEYPGKIPSDLDVYDIILFPGKHTWESLDAYYRNELPKHIGQPYYRNLEEILFYHLIEEFNLDELADGNTVEYYVKKQIDHGVLAEPELFVRCLKRMERDGAYKYLLDYASNKYRMDMYAISQKSGLEPFKAKYEILKEYVDHLKVVFNVKGS